MSEFFEYDQNNEALRLIQHMDKEYPEDWDGAAIRAELRRQHGEIEALKAERDALHKELDDERMKHAACGVIAMANTPESARKARDMHPAYRSASVRDVENAVDREMALRAERDALLADAERYRYLRIHCYRYKWPNNEHDRAMHLSFTVSGIWANNHDPEVLDGCIDTAREVKP